MNILKMPALNIVLKDLYNTLKCKWSLIITFLLTHTHLPHILNSKSNYLKTDTYSKRNKKIQNKLRKCYKIVDLVCVDMTVNGCHGLRLQWRVLILKAMERLE